MVSILRAVSNISISSKHSSKRHRHRLEVRLKLMGRNWRDTPENAIKMAFFKKNTPPSSRFHQFFVKSPQSNYLDELNLFFREWLLGRNWLDFSWNHHRLITFFTFSWNHHKLKLITWTNYLLNFREITTINYLNKINYIFHEILAN